MSCAEASNPVPGNLFSPRAMHVFAAVTLAAILGGSSAPTPLYHLYQQSWQLAPVMLTVIFSVYALVLLATLLTLGSLSDYVGRRPILFAGLVLSVLSMALFALASSAEWLIAARAVQGLAAGILSSTLGATLLDTNPRTGPLVNSTTPLLGMSVGALGSSALVTYAPRPTELIYEVLLALFVILAVLVWRMPETALRKPGALASLRPQISVPRQARAALLCISPSNIANWSLGGFYLSLMPSLLRVATGLDSPFVGGGLVALLTLSGATGILIARHWQPNRILLAGTSTVAVGVAITLAGVERQEVALMLFGTFVAGLGFGTSFYAATRTIMPLALPNERAGLLAAFFLQSYLAFSLPVIILGWLIPVLGLVAATQIYGSIVIALALMSLVATLLMGRR
ncbi:putative MFS family arabinose efflux permease [Dongia mobilis]|uniref:Putative MFS family arabinose efflux permease n=1 Tax=Dongia mobilis TaxID=578943 RepID=A0A4R6WUA8_9PROT|nr:MFS transporter [Dongia mobilis]TDQ80508.1 putative MFS family arabinose efflux permease [Dongia mobilis]